MDLKCSRLQIHIFDVLITYTTDDLFQFRLGITQIGAEGFNEKMQELISVYSVVFLRIWLDGYAVILI